MESVGGGVGGHIAALLSICPGMWPNVLALVEVEGRSEACTLSELLFLKTGFNIYLGNDYQWVPK